MSRNCQVRYGKVEELGELLDKYGALAALLVRFTAPPSESEEKNAKMALESLTPNKPGIHR